MPKANQDSKIRRNLWFSNMKYCIEKSFQFCSFNMHVANDYIDKAVQMKQASFVQ